MEFLSSPYLGFSKDARGVRHLWERFNAGLIDRHDCRAPYHQMLLDEWQRCTTLGVDVAMTKGRRLNAEEYRLRHQAEHLLLETSVPIIRDVSSFLADVPGILILTERTGTVLHISGDAAVRERAASRSGIVEGSVWDEHTAGTNGMGTALMRRQPVHVFATEHFCEGWHSWSCAAAPIFDGDGQTVLGVIDFTTVETEFRDQALGLAVSVANSIQARMTLHRELERRRLLVAFSDAARHYPNDDLLALDPAGRLVAYTPNERCRTLAERWGRRDSEPPLPTQTAMPVTAPDSGNGIGTVVILARPAATQRVFRSAQAPTRKEDELGLDSMACFGDFVTVNPATRRMLDDLKRIASADVNVLIVGESGTGKELLARQIHTLSRRWREPYLAVNCGAISEHLMESTFFGYVRGAFSGADPKGRAGYFESAAGGTLFLDEVGELPAAMQAALLRVLEDGSFQRVGSCETQRASCRIIAATHRDLDTMINEGRFRRDLYYRLKVVQRTVLPLRERPDDIALLATRFAEQMRRKHGQDEAELTPQTLAVLRRHAWPGNARELRNAIEAAVLCATTGTIGPDCLPPEILPTTGSPDGPPTAAVPEGLAAVRDYERRLILGLLREHGQASRVAQVLGIARSTLYRKLEELGIRRSDYHGPLA